MNQGIKKKILHAGHGDQIDFADGWKAVFHFKTQIRRDDGPDPITIDDTRSMTRPMEFIFGKKFKLEVWESCIRMMRLQEVTEFTVDKSLVTAYPLVSKMVRQAFGGKGLQKPGHEHGSTHCCGMMAFNQEGMGHADLDDLVKNPCDLVFTFELLNVVRPGEYEKESWAMDDQEKLCSIPKMRADGNQLYRDGRFVEAGQKYAEALGRLEQLMLREKPGDEEWTALDQMKIPLLLNYSQCKLLEKDYYPVIEHTSEVLKKDPDNVKALFRRAQAHVHVWNPDEARRDYELARTLDPNLSKTVDKELKSLDDEIRSKNQEDKAKLQGKIF